MAIPTAAPSYPHHRYPFVVEGAKTAINAFVSSRLDYCNSLLLGAFLAVFLSVFRLDQKTYTHRYHCSTFVDCTQKTVENVLV